MNIYRLSEWALKELVNNLAEDNYVFMPVFCQQRDGPRSRWEFVRWNPQETRFQMNCRSMDALCQDFFFPPDNILHTFPEGQPGREDKDLALLGLKSCNIHALQILDRAFAEGDLSYSFYDKRRRETTIISCDCLQIADTCFCNKVGGRPYPTDGFDLNVSTLPHYGDILVEVGENSEKGKKIVDRNEHLFAEATEDEIELRRRRREKMMDQIESQNSYFEVKPDIGKASREAPFWEKYSTKNCHCTAYTLACPTSLTLQIVQGQGDRKEVVDKVWDSATAKDIFQELESDDPTDSRVKEMFYDKFKQYHKQFGEYGCSGCGQCISAAGGEIDIRDIIADANNCPK